MIISLWIIINKLLIVLVYWTKLITCMAGYFILYDIAFAKIADESYNNLLSNSGQGSYVAIIVVLL